MSPAPTTAIRSICEASTPAPLREVISMASHDPGNARLPPSGTAARHACGPVPPWPRGITRSFGWSLAALPVRTISTSSGRESGDRKILPALERRLVRDDPRRGVGDRLVDAHGRQSLLEQGLDELMGQERVRAFVAAVVAERGREHVGLPPLALPILFEGRELPDEASAVLLGLAAAPDDDRAEAVG